MGKYTSGTISLAICEAALHIPMEATAEVATARPREAARARGAQCGREEEVPEEEVSKGRALEIKHYGLSNVPQIVKRIAVT